MQHVRTKGFNLSGRLAVLSIIALLLSLLSPAAHSYAESSKTTLDLAKGSIVIGNGTVSGKTSSGAAAAYNASGYVITSSSSAVSSNTVTINGGEQQVDLHNLKITTGYNGASPVSIENAGTKVRLTLSGTNVLTAGNPKKAALGVAEGTELTIGTIDGSVNHVLTANGYGGSAAAIGGNESGASGKITINEGTINAKFTSSGNYGAAIGGGQSGAGGVIVINGGVVTAESYGGSAAAIGGGYSSTGYNGKSTSVTVNGGTVTTKIPNAATYDSIGYGKVGTTYASAVQAATSVVINGGAIINKNDSNNITSLLYKRLPVNGSGETVYSVGIKFDDAPSNGTTVTLSHASGSVATKTLNSGNVYTFLPAGAHEVVATREDTGSVYYGLVDVNTSSSNTPNSSGAVSRTIKSTPVIAVVNADAADADLNDGKTSVLVIGNYSEIVNGGSYLLEAGNDYTIQWYKGATLIAGDADDASRLTVTPDKGDTFKAKFVATSTGKAIGSTSFSSVKTTLGPKNPSIPVPGIDSNLSVTSEAEFTKQPDPTAGAITYTVKLTANDGSNAPIAGATVRFYQDGSKYTRVTGADGIIRFTFGALLPGEHAIKIAFETGKVNGVQYNGSTYDKSFTVVKPEKPSGFTTIAAKSGTTNGKIFGADESQEYIKWIPTIGINQQIYPVTGDVIENLGPSLYSIRYKAFYDGDVYSLASDYRYLVWVQTAQWTVTPVATDSVVWETGAVDVIAGGSAQFVVTPKEGYEIQAGDIQVKYANYSYDSSTHILSLDTITSDIRIVINATKIE
ncbi:carboxypeptidase-like regulatory domain-containing protein [Cohnella abietis]|uniref:Bacterial Ig-like domain-containing protein n=1 Tax=Cohnella abietis TaxID=2507935 RepID=A0A3T1CYB1_9BACL|nr:carboxypeptidase-like regulatory domain-containing protein [Cohnella abietis]BBI30818.1 hypothetical protein KCTCHS21_02170 [Cohnella abietis]